MMRNFLIIFGLSFFQNSSYSIVSRARNRDNYAYLIISSVISNGIWFLTFRQLILSDMNLFLFIPYCMGSVVGSLVGTRLSMLIEKWLGAESDSHLSKKGK